MRLKKVEIDDFKCIDRLEFEPSMINLIVGRNDTGKTSLLEAITIPHYAGIVDEYDNPHHLIFSGREVAKIRCRFDSTETKSEIRRPDEKTAQSEFKKNLFRGLGIYFKNEGKDFTGDVKRKINLILEDKSIKDLMKSLQAKSVCISVDGDVCFCIQFQNNDAEIMEKTSELLGKALFAVHGDIGDEASEETFAPLVSQILFSLKGPRRSKMSDQILFFDHLDVPEKEDFGEKDAARIKETEDFIKSENVLEGLVKFDFDCLIFDHDGKEYSVPFEFMGDGFKKMATILWHITDPDSDNKIILMDGPDGGMHPRFTSRLVEIITRFSQKRKIQFFVTTQNADFIDGFFDEEMDADAKSYLEKNLSVLRMNAKKKRLIPEHLTYKEAAESRDKFFLDLRGI